MNTTFSFSDDTPGARSARAMEQLFLLLYKAAEQFIQAERQSSRNPVPLYLVEKVAYENVEEVIDYFLAQRPGALRYHTDEEREAVQAEVLRLYYSFARKDMGRDAGTYRRRATGSLDECVPGAEGTTSRDTFADRLADKDTCPRPGVPLPMFDPDDELAGLFGRQVWETLCDLFGEEWAAVLWERLHYDQDWKDIAACLKRKVGAVRKKGWRDIERLALELERRGYLPEGGRSNRPGTNESPDANEDASGDGVFIGRRYPCPICRSLLPHLTSPMRRRRGTGKWRIAGSARSIFLKRTRKRGKIHRMRRR